MKDRNDKNNLIKMSDISKSFLTDELETYALSNINISIDRGEFVSVAGPSGCGKSTLLSIMGLLDNASKGSYHLNGVDVSRLDSKQQAILRNKEIGFIFQNFNLIGDMTVYENIELPLVYRGVKKQERKIKVESVLEKVQMSHRNAHFPSQLSGGQQQRIAIARALVGEPSFLLADEPTGNLDSKNGEKAMALLEQLNNDGTTICMVTHDSRYTSLASRVIHIFDGRVISEDEHAQEVA